MLKVLARFRLLARHAAAVLLTVAVAIMGLPLAANAAAGAAVLLRRATPVPVPTGEPISYQLFFACGAVADPTCVSSTIDIAVPSYISLSVGAHPWVQSTTRTATGYTIALANAIPAGSSAWFSVTMTAANGTTPTSSFNAVATARITNGPTATSNSDGAVTASSNLGILKSVIGVAQVGAPTRYELRSCTSGADPTKGQLWLQSGQIVDTLPAGAVFVAASGTGTYSAGTNQVTWTGIPNLGDGPCTTSDAVDAWVDVLYATPTFTPSSEVTNNASVDGTPYASSTPVSATTSLTHGFIPVTPTGNAYKWARTQQYWTQCSYGPCSYPGKYLNGQGTEVSWALNMTNTSAVPAEFEFVDMITCPTEGPANTIRYKAVGVPCAQPLFIVERLVLDEAELQSSPSTALNIQDAYRLGWRPRWMSSSGATGDFESADLVTFEPVGVPTGERISEVTLPRDSRLTMPATTGLTMLMEGYLAPDLPSYAYYDAARPYLYNGFRYRMFSGATMTVNYAGEEYMQAKPRSLMTAMMPRTYYGWTSTQFMLENWSDRAAPISGGVLLPVGIDSVSAVMNRRRGTALPGNVPVETAFDIETIKNFQGTGRTMVRVTSKPGFLVNPQSGIDLYVGFTNLGDRYPTGVNIPYTVFSSMPGMNLDACDALPPYAFMGTRPTAVDDTLDFDNDGRTVGQKYCHWDTWMRATSSSQPTLQTSTFVQGDQDATPQASPNVGDISDGGSAQFRVDVTNSGTGDLTDAWVYDVLPAVGDSGVSAAAASTPRESAFNATLAGPVTTGSAGVTIEYSTSANPCRPEVGISTGCASDWTTTPASWSAVRAYRARIATIGASGSVSLSFTLSAPLGVPSGATAWNNVASTATDGATQLLAVDSPKVGMARPLTDVALVIAIAGAPGTTAQTRRVTVTARHDTTITTAANGSLSYSGPASRAQNVVASVTIPPGVTVVPGSIAGLGFNPATGVWTVGDLFVASSKSISFDVQASSIGAFNIAGQITANSVGDVDSTPGDCTYASPSQDDCAVAALVVANPQIALRTLVADGLGSSTFLDANSGSGEVGHYLSGQRVTYRFVVSNTGVVPVDSVTLDQTQLGADCPPAGSVIAPGDTLTFECTTDLGAFVGSSYLDATVAATGGGVATSARDGAAIDVVFVPPLPASISMSAVTADPAVGESGDDLVFPVGTPLVWRVVANNTGGDALAAVSIVDELGAPIDPAMCARIGGVDTSVLLPGDTLTCEVSFSAVSGGANKTFAVTAVATSAATVQASDSTGYTTGVLDFSLQFQAFDTAAQEWVNADITDGRRPQFGLYARVAYRGVITNLGTIALVNARLSTSTGCFSFVPRLEPGDSTTVACTGVHNVVGLDTVSAYLWDQSYTTLRTDPADVEIVDVDIDVELQAFDPASASWVDADSAPFPAYVAGDEVLWRAVVTNLGAVDAVDVNLTSSTSLNCPSPIARIPIGGSEIVSCTSYSTDYHSVTASAGNDSATDDARVTIEGALAVELQVQDPTSGLWVNADVSDGLRPRFITGDPIHLRATVTNPSAVELRNITVRFDGECPDLGGQTFAAGESRTFACDRLATTDMTFYADAYNSGLYTSNTADVAASPPLDIRLLVAEGPGGAYVEADNTDGLAGSYVDGETVSWRVYVTNQTTVTATDVRVDAPWLPDCATDIAVLAAGETTQIDCSSIAAGPLVGFATVSLAGAEVDIDTARIIGSAIYSDAVVALDVQLPDGSWTTAEAGDVTPTFLVGDTITWRATVSNPLAWDLPSVRLFTGIPGCDVTIDTLLANETRSYTCTSIASTDETRYASVSVSGETLRRNPATVRIGAGPAPFTVSVLVRDPATGQFVDGNETPFPVYTAGSTVTWRVVVRNTGVDPVTVAFNAIDPVVGSGSGSGGESGGPLLRLDLDVLSDSTWRCGLADSFTLQAGEVLTSDCESPEIASQQRSVTLFDGPDVAASDFARMITIQPSILGKRVWLDTNGNDRIDGAESGMEGIIVNLLRNGQVIATTTTDADGNYSFGGLFPGVYTIQYSFPIGWIATVSSSRAAQLAMASSSGRTSFSVTITEGEQRDDANLGLRAESAAVTPTPTSPGDTPRLQTPPTKPRAGLPSTGSDSRQSLEIAMVLLLVGAGLTIVSRSRRQRRELRRSALEAKVLSVEV